MTSQKFALIRVSTDRQSTDRQTTAVVEAGVPLDNVIYERGVSGTKGAADREGLQELLLRVRDGDTVVLAELSRLGRRTEELLRLIRELNERGVVIQCLSPALSFDGSPLAVLLTACLGAVYEMEVENLRSRVRAGLAASRAQGRIGGRRPSLSPAQQKEVRSMRAAGRPVKEVAEIFNVSERTIRRACEGA